MRRDVMLMKGQLADPYEEDINTPEDYLKDDEDYQDVKNDE